MNSEKFLEIKGYYDNGYWSEEQVKQSVVKGFITTKEYETITGDLYSNPITIIPTLVPEITLTIEQEMDSETGEYSYIAPDDSELWIHYIRDEKEAEYNRTNMNIVIHAPYGLPPLSEEEFGSRVPMNSYKVIGSIANSENSITIFTSSGDQLIGINLSVEVDAETGDARIIINNPQYAQSYLPPIEIHNDGTDDFYHPQI